MKCQFCNGEVPQFSKSRIAYVTATLNRFNSEENEVHVHGSIGDKESMTQIVENIIKETGLEDVFSARSKPKLDIKEVVFHNRQRIGDMLMMTCGLRDFKKAFPNARMGVISTAMHIWDHNPYIDRELDTKWFEKKVTELEKDLTKEERGKRQVYELEPGKFYVRIGPKSLTTASNRKDWHFANAFRVSMEEALGVHIEQGESRPDIWLTREEYDAPRITEKPYWIIITGGEKGWGCKMYPSVRWQEVIDQNPDILFYQLGSKGDNHVKLKGENVVDYIGKTEDRDTGLRDLFRLFLNAEGSMGLVSFHMHLSGALKKPCVVVAGAREPVSFTRYAGHQYLSNDGCLPCAAPNACWHCDITACSNLVTMDGRSTTLEEKATQEQKDNVMPKCVDMISSEEVSRALRRYYEGGRLKIGVASEKMKFPNVVPTPPKKIEPPKPEIRTYGLTFNGGALTERDWEFIQETIKENGCRTVLEFGGGLSTLLLNDIGLEKVVTYEDKQGWIDKLKGLKAGMDIRLYDGKSISDLKPGIQYDLAFVDGPAGDMPREFTTQIASQVAKVVIVHDAGREWARKYQEKYLVPGFEGPGKGGHRCHLWVKKNVTPIRGKISEPTIVPVPPKAQAVPIVNPKAKSVKIVSTARGWGGCARSITTLMKLLIQAGHKVEFIPFRNSVGSKEFQECLKNGLSNVKVTEHFESVKEGCDVMLMYADDYIWEFGKPELSEVFSSIGAQKKIMMLNYRRGSVGQIEWTRNWDKYMFLNSAQESELLRVHPGVKTKVLASCVELDEFFKVQPNFDEFLRVVRHSSQGDTKFSPDTQQEIERILNYVPGSTISMLPGPSTVAESIRFKKAPRTGSAAEIAKFLATGNLFWYSLPNGYMDMGPRVIIEAMAAGLPIIADNWGGAVDRVTPECGWLCDTKQKQAEIMRSTTMKEFEEKGAAARQRALEEFSPAKWIEEVVS